MSKENFKEFINDNKDKIYANTPQVSSISSDDDWADETEWDDKKGRLTREQIVKVVTEVANRVSEDIDKILVDNIKSYTELSKECDLFKEHFLEFAVMNTALQVSTHIIKESLCDLLCDEE